MDKYVILNEKAKNLLKSAADECGYSARVIHGLLHLVRTSVDLQDDENLQMSNIEIVVNLRDLDLSNSRLVVLK